MRDFEAPGWLLDQVADENAECWLWTGPRMRRYGGQGGDRAVVSRGGRTRNVGRALWEHVVGPLPAGLIVRHSCDNPMCVRPSHLLLGTPADNTYDARERKRLRPGGRVA